MQGDEGQDFPLLADVHTRDPYSLQLSFVFPKAGRLATESDSFRLHAERTVREETPAHLTPYILWLDKLPMDAFRDAYRNWLVKLAQLLDGIRIRNTDGYRRKPSAPRRPRSIDRTPRARQDLPLAGPAGPGRATDGGAQCRHPDLRSTTASRESPTSSSATTRSRSGRRWRATGPGWSSRPRRSPMISSTGSSPASSAPACRLTCTSPRPSRSGSTPRSRRRVTNARTLDPAIPQPADSDPRIVAYGADVAVQVDATQDGVSYRLIQGPGVGNEPEKVISEQDVTGTLGSIVLREARRDRRGHGYPCAGDQDLPAGRRSAGHDSTPRCSTSCCR